MFTSETQVNLRVSKSSTSIHFESTTNGLARPTDLPLADQSLTSMLRAKCWRMPWPVGRRSSKGLVMAWRPWLNHVESIEMVRCLWRSMEKYGKVRKNPGCIWDIAKYLRSPRKKYRRYRRGSWMALDGPVGLVRQLSDAFELSKLTALSLQRQNSDGALLRFAWMNWWSSKHRASQVFKPWFHCGKNSEHFVIVGMDFAMMWRSDMEWQWWNMMKHDILVLDFQGQMVTWASRRRKTPWQWQSLPFSGDWAVSEGNFWCLDG